MFDLYYSPMIYSFLLFLVCIERSPKILVKVTGSEVVKYPYIKKMFFHHIAKNSLRYNLILLRLDCLLILKKKGAVKFLHHYKYLWLGLPSVPLLHRVSAE